MTVSAGCEQQSTITVADDSHSVDVAAYSQRTK